MQTKYNFHVESKKYGSHATPLYTKKDDRLASIKSSEPFAINGNVNPFFVPTALPEAVGKDPTGAHVPYTKVTDQPFDMRTHGSDYTKVFFQQNFTFVTPGKVRVRGHVQVSNRWYGAKSGGWCWTRFRVVYGRQGQGAATAQEVYRTKGASSNGELISLDTTITLGVGNWYVRFEAYQHSSRGDGSGETYNWWDYQSDALAAGTPMDTGARAMKNGKTEYYVYEQ